MKLCCFPLCYGCVLYCLVVLKDLSEHSGISHFALEVSGLLKSRFVSHGKVKTRAGRGVTCLRIFHNVKVTYEPTTPDQERGKGLMVI